MVDAVYRSDSRRVFATLIRAARRLRPRRGGTARRVCRGRRAMAAGRRARQSAGVARVGRPVQSDRRHAPSRPVRCLADASWPSDSTRTPADAADAGRRGRRGRPPAADLHLLPSGPVAGGPSRAHAPRSLRTHDRGDRQRLPHRSAHAGPADRPRQGEDSRRAAFRIKCRRAKICRTGSIRCCK